MPMPSQIDGLIGYHHYVKGPGRDGQLATGAEVLLLCLVGLYRVDRYVEKSAHAITATVSRTAPTTIAMSNADFSFSRNGLNPTPRR